MGAAGSSSAHPTVSTTMDASVAARPLNAPTLVLEEHFTVTGGALANGSFGEIFAVTATPLGDAFVRGHLRALGRPADGALPHLIVKAPTRNAKPLEAQSASDRQAREDEIAREKEALRAWHHQGIVTYFGDFAKRHDPLRACIVLEACYGMGDGRVPVLDAANRPMNPDNLGASSGDFWRWVATRTQPSDAVFRFIAWQLLAPVAYLHSHDVAHRDLKNENFLVAGAVRSAAGEDIPVMKISDFGSARALTIVEQTGPQSRQATIARGIDGAAKYVGTPQHIAPEILAHAHFGLDEEAAAARSASGHDTPLISFRGSYTTKCDVYSLGIALFATLMSGFKPLDGQEDVFEIKAQVLDGSVLKTARRRLENRRLRLETGASAAAQNPVDAATRDFVLSMLTIDPTARPSAKQLLDDVYFDGIREEARRLFGHEAGDSARKAAGAAGGAAAAP